MTRLLRKAELHCHLEGAVPPALALAQARRYGVATDAFMKDGAYVWHDFTSFLGAYDAVSGLFRSEDDYALLTETYLDDLAAAGAIYSELFISPDHAEAVGVGADAYVAGIGRGIEAVRARSGIECRMVVVGLRHCGPERVEWAARYAAAARNPLMTGFNMAGEERMGAVADFARAFDIARDAGLGITIHAGELSGASSVRDALDLIRPTRIGHGVRAVEDPGLLARLADEGVVLEVCPGSNVALGVFPDFPAHPLRRLQAAGVKVTLNSDDPPFFKTSLEREYEIASRIMGFSDEELDTMTRTAIEAAFVDEETRARLLARL
ncbi:adenosine deaminase [Rhizobium subbaraonis]|uniref:Adenine deaminase n=1 Tax=Rhizobium subbaraonis TaxID=908946 RepID=A0A285UI92_9HYPH|nr:adenosine deaminase [Rhizobium subbaraonis]SOC41128.1 adenosine deaminase [Rhizobium subbaraonis]